jgi:general stress protein 26
MAKDKGGNDGKGQEDPKASKNPENGDRKDLKRLRKLIKGARVAMLTTIAPDGTLRSRPMATLKAPFEGDVWFFTRATAPKADEIKDNDHVNVSFSDGDDNRYLSISGTASLVRDKDRLEQLWSGRLKNWFPDGKKDPDLALLRVRVDRADYWDAKTAAMVHLGGLVKSSLGGDPTVANRKTDNPAGPAGSTSGAGAQG